MISKREHARRFCQAVRHATTTRALADVIGVSETWVRKVVSPGKRKAKRCSISRQALAAMWNDWSKGRATCFYKLTTNDGEHWTQPQISHLLDTIGTRRFVLICAELERTPSAARHVLLRLRRQNRITQQLEFTVCQLARALDRTPYWVRDLAKDFTLRSYTDKRGMMIHRHDARWLLDWWDGKSAIPKHPGKDDGA